MKKSEFILLAVILGYVLAAGAQDPQKQPKLEHFDPNQAGVATEYIARDSVKLWDWPIFPEGFHSAHLMELARLQAWTLKPAILRSQPLRHRLAIPRSLSQPPTRTNMGYEPIKLSLIWCNLPLICEKNGLPFVPTLVAFKRGFILFTLAISWLCSVALDEAVSSRKS